MTVVREDNTIEPYEILSPRQIMTNVAKKYEDIPITQGSRFRLEDTQFKTVEEAMTFPEPPAIEAEEVGAQAGIAVEEGGEATEFVPFLVP